MGKERDGSELMGSIGSEGSGGRVLGLEVSGLETTADSGQKARSPAGCEMPCSPSGVWHLTTGLPLRGKRAFVQSSLDRSSSQRMLFSRR